ncbi:L-ribulose-5-phosphate 4-epimerase UlaF [Paenibacillus sp. S02]|nr:L-ribulose-5-phosphate 4-epimerase UlaF [Paenibacillus sp. S02]
MKAEPRIKGRYNPPVISHMKLVLVTSSIADFRNDSKRCALYIVEQLKKEVWVANWLFQGAAYEELKAEQLVVMNLQGDIVEDDLRPSSDTPTHLALYRSFVLNTEFTSMDQALLDKHFLRKHGAERL